MYFYLYAKFWKNDGTFILFFICVINWLLQNSVIILKFAVVFIIYWHLIPSVKQGFLNPDFDITFIVTACNQLHTVLKSQRNNCSNYRYLFYFFNWSISMLNVGNYFRKITNSVWSYIFKKKMASDIGHKYNR